MSSAAHHTPVLFGLCLLACPALVTGTGCGSEWGAGVLRLVMDVLAAQDASHLVLVVDPSPTGETRHVHADTCG